MTLIHLGHRTRPLLWVKAESFARGLGFFVGDTPTPQRSSGQVIIKHIQATSRTTCRLDKSSWAIDKSTRNLISLQARHSLESQIQLTSRGRLTHQRGTRDKDRAEILSRVFGRGTLPR